MLEVSPRLAEALAVNRAHDHLLPDLAEAQVEPAEATEAPAAVEMAEFAAEATEAVGPTEDE